MIQHNKAQRQMGQHDAKSNSRISLLQKSQGITKKTSPQIENHSCKKTIKDARIIEQHSASYYPLDE